MFEPQKPKQKKNDCNVHTYLPRPNTFDSLLLSIRLDVDVQTSVGENNIIYQEGRVTDNSFRKLSDKTAAKFPRRDFIFQYGG